APGSGELPLETLSPTFRGLGPLAWYAIGGGEPFLRKDLAGVYGAVNKLCRPKVVTIPTNGWYTENTFAAVLRILEQSKGRLLFVSFSVEGPQEMHDSIRSKGSWK